MALYLFQCATCKNKEQRSIAIADYEQLKHVQFCAKDQQHMERVFEMPNLGYSSFRTTFGRGDTPRDYNSQVMKRIETSSALDGDVSYVLENGTPTMKRTMEKVVDQRHKEKKHLDMMYGSDMWDGKNNKGELTKVLDYKPSEEGSLL